VLQSQDRKIVSAGYLSSSVAQSPSRCLFLLTSLCILFEQCRTDIVILFLNQDPNLLRSYIVQQEGNSLLGLLVSCIFFASAVLHPVINILRVFML
jgi:hypothetical protein